MHQSRKDFEVQYDRHRIDMFLLQGEIYNNGMNAGGFSILWNFEELFSTVVFILLCCTNQYAIRTQFPHQPAGNSSYGSDPICSKRTAVDH